MIEKRTDTRLCRERHPTGQITCNLPLGHDGRHEARADRGVTSFTWERTNARFAPSETALSSTVEVDE